MLVKRPGGQVVSGGFDPFDEPAQPEPVAPPAAEPPARDGYDPFADSDAGDARPQPAVPAFEAELPQADVEAAPMMEAAPMLDEDALADQWRAAGQRVESPRIAAGPRDERDSIISGPRDDEPLEAAQEAIVEELQRRGVERDRPGGVAPNPFRPEELGDEAVDPLRDVEREFFDPAEDDEDPLSIDPMMQQAPGGFDPTAPAPPLTPQQQAERERQREKERARYEAECNDIITAVRTDDIRSVSLDIKVQGVPGEDVPFECGLMSESFQARRWPQTTYMWKASGLCHKPLYFEQVQVERYGHSWPPVVQPLLSGAHFFGSLPLLPYKMGLTTPNECIYTLGHYRPGNCAPYMIEAVPFTWRAAAFEAAAWTGGAFAIP